MATQQIQNQLILHNHFRERLREEFPDADDETLADTLEGLTDLSDLLAEVIRSALEEEAFCEALKARITDMRERAARLGLRAEKKRQLVGETMAQADLKRLTLPDLTISLRPGPAPLVVTREEEVPSAFWKAQPPKLDRQGLSQALKAGESIPGAVLGNPQPDQIKALKGKLKAAHVRTREENGAELSYIEGWFTIAEANRIFGFDGWNRETVESVCVWQGRSGGRRVCYYTARVRVSVHAEGRILTREGSGFGGGSGDNPGEAHEVAIKEAETDAMKRALMTFGNRFGLALYDPEKKGVSKPRTKTPDPTEHWPVTLPGENSSILCTTPQAFYGELRKALETLTTVEEVQALWQTNEDTLKAIRNAHPHLTDQHGAHYTAVFAKLCKTRVKDILTPPEAPPTAVGGETPPRPRAPQIRSLPTLPGLRTAARPGPSPHLRAAPGSGSQDQR
jgi:hypothetical protein